MAHADILRHNVVSMVAPAIVLQNIVAALPDGTRPAPSLRVVEVGGSPLPAKLRALTRERLCPWVRSHYGSSETGAIASAPFEALGDAPGAVGYVHAGVAAEIVDEADNVLPPGTEGIVRTRSPHAATGYMDDPDTSARVFRDGWFYSGDVGTLSADGVLTIAGRIGDFINQGGAKVAPSVVEAALLALPQVTEAVAFGAADRMGLTRIWAAIVADGPVPPAALSAHCARTLGDKAPAHVLQLRALPRNANGKILRVELIRFAESQQR
jgi:acyl-coenzyme A synthetase/AMP-(fatty) acid ligase